MTRRVSRTVSLLALAALVVFGATSPAKAAWNGTAEIRLGDTRYSEFEGGTLSELHVYRFYATAGTRLDVTLKIGKKVTLVPNLQLFGLNGIEVDLGESLIVKKTIKIKKFFLENTGYYELRVTATEGVGDYSLKTKGKFPKKFKEEQAATTYEFESRDVSLLTASVKPAKKSPAVPLIISLTDPDGNPVAIDVDVKKIKKVELAKDGMYVLAWRNDGDPGNVQVTVTLKTVRSKEKVEEEVQETQPLGVIDKGDPDVATGSAPGFVGSESCRVCHDEIAHKVANSFHNSKLRNTFREGAAGYVIPPEVVDLFKAGTDLTLLPVYQTLNGLSLSFVEGDALPYKITVGQQIYDVMFVMGGNGPWKQRFVVKIGGSHYITPVQYNDKAKTFAAYHPEHWFDTNTGEPLPAMATTNSWERRCGACHSTGLKLSYDAMSTEYRAGYAELNVGCEACHGAGNEHVLKAAAGDADAADAILNPRDLVDGTAEGVRTADLVCAQCHNRGAGGTPTGAPKSTGYPWKEGNSIYTPGDPDFHEYFTSTTSAGDFWRYKDNPMGFVPTPTDPADDTWLSGLKHRQQGIDIMNGPHAPDQLYDGVCFDCHNAHADSSRKHMMADTLTREGSTFRNIENDDNSLCLACHKGHGDFEDLTADDVEAITDGAVPVAVVDAVVDHMKDHAAMPIDAVDYDPAGTGTGRCSKCHMPKMAKSAVYTTDAAGNNVGDIHAHTFIPVWPNVSQLVTITNSCNGCHPIDANDMAADIIDEWATDPDSDGTFHADTPRNFQNGVANHNRAGGVACAACHTTEGFVEIQVNGTLHDLTGAGDADARFDMVKHAIGRDVGITCKACHGKQSDGTFAAGENPLRFPKAELCGKCHNNETVLLEDYIADGEIVRHPQREMIDGVEGGEAPGFTYSNSAHTALTATDGCVTCHYNQAAGGKHSFEPTLESCNVVGCHSGNPLTTFNRPAFGDYDGDGTTEGIQEEVSGALDVLKTAILGTATSTGAIITYDDEDHVFLIDGDEGDTAALDATNATDAALMRAMFNHYWVSFDASGGIHNTSYGLKLVQTAYMALTGMDWTGTKK